jgi:hypothetical protein
MGLRTLLGLKRPKKIAAPPAFDPRWKDLKMRAFGMLPPAVYEEIYRTVFRGPDLDIVEIGGAAGAASIAAALGLKESGKSSRVIVVEKLQGGSRDRYGDYATNLNTIRDNFRAFDVESHVVLFPERVNFENAGRVKALIETPQISALMIDADGKINRDLALFGTMLAEDGKIIIDDYRDDATRFRADGGGTKLVKVFRLANYLIGAGMLKVERQIGSTLFCTVPPGADLSLIDQNECEQIARGVEAYRQQYIAQRAADV